MSLLINEITLLLINWSAWDWFNLIAAGRTKLRHRIVKPFVI